MPKEKNCTKKVKSHYRQFFETGLRSVPTGESALSIELKNTERLNFEDGVKFLVYGESGSGKTRLCATLSRPVILSSEHGLRSIREAKLPYIEIDNFEKIGEVYTWLTNSKEAANFDCVCIDSISEITEIVLANLKKKAKDPRQAYGEVQDLAMSMIRTFRDLPKKHIYMIAKQERIQDQNSGGLFFGPALTGQKLGTQISYLFDEVFALQVFTDPQTKQEIRALRTRKDLQYIAKDRSGKLELWENPNLGEIITKILA